MRSSVPVHLRTYREGLSQDRQSSFQDADMPQLSKPSKLHLDVQTESRPLYQLGVQALDMISSLGWYASRQEMGSHLLKEQSASDVKPTICKKKRIVHLKNPAQDCYANRSRGHKMGKVLTFDNWPNVWKSSVRSASVQLNAKFRRNSRQVRKIISFAGSCDASEATAWSLMISVKLQSKFTMCTNFCIVLFPGLSSSSSDCSNVLSVLSMFCDIRYFIHSNLTG